MKAVVPSANADKVAEDLRENRRIPTFIVRYDLHARITRSQSEIQADLKYFSETKAAKTLLGTTADFGEVWLEGGTKRSSCGAIFPNPEMDRRYFFEGR